MPIDIGLGILEFDDPDPEQQAANSHAKVRVYVEIYFRLEFTVDTTTGTTTFADAPISGLKDELWTQQGGNLFNGGPLQVDAPDSPLAIVISAFTQTDFEAAGSLKKAFDATVYDVFWQKLNASQPFSINDRTWMTTTIDVTMGNWSTGPTGTVIVPPVITAHINGEAHANLELHLAMSDPMDFKVTARLDADWTFDNVLLTPGLPISQLGTLPYVDILDVTVDLDSTLRTLGNILDSIQDITNNPATSTYMAVMDTDLPIIGKSIFEIADAMGAIQGGWGDAISTIKYINSLHIAGQQTGGTINLGSFRIADPRAGGPIVITQTQLGDGAPQAVDNFFNYAFGINFPNENYEHGLHFWFLEDPMNVLFPTMMGEDRTLMTFTMPALDFTFNLDDVFDSFGDFELFPGPEWASGVSLNGEMHIRLDVDMGYDTAGLRRRELNQSPDKDDAKYGLYINADQTYFELNAGMVLSTGVPGVSVEGGLYAGLKVIPVGYLDATDPNRVRPGHLLRDAWKMVQAYGDIYAEAHFEHPGGSETLIEPYSLINSDFFGFDTETHSVPSGQTITVTKTNTSEKIFVLNQRIDPSTERPVYGTPDEYELVIAVLTDDVTDYYRVAKFVKQPDGSYTRTNYNTANLIVVVGPTYGANYKDIHKTIVVDELDGGAGPVNAVILGGNGIDTLLYYGSGTAVIVGGDENDTIRALPLTGSGGPSLIVSDYVDAEHPLTNPLNLPQGRMDEILWAATPLPPAGPPGADDDPPPTDPGKNKVVASTNATVINVDLPDLSPPGSGAGSGQSEGGSAPGSSLENESLSLIELVSGNPAGAPGFVSGSSYQLVLKAAIGTPQATGNLNLSAVSTANGAALHAQGSQINVTAVGVSLFYIHSFGGDLHIGDLTTLPDLDVVVANQPLSAGTSTVFDGPSSGAAHVDISHDDDVFGQLFVTGALAYASVQFVGLSYRDRVRVKNAGGTVSVDDLTGAGLGNLLIDNSGRPVGSTAAAAITINNRAASLWVLPDDDSNNVRLSAVNEPNILLVDHRAIDTLNLNLTGTSEHSAFIDASTMKGNFNIVATDAETAKNDITLAKVGTAVDVSVDGGVANTTLYFGQNRLSDIRSDVTASNLQLHVDNFGATDARSMTFTPTTFTGWDAGGLSPTLHYNNLRGVLTVDAGGDDRYNLAGSPIGIASSDFNSFTDVRSSIYATSWQSMLRIDGDWQAFFGQRIHTNGTVERVKLLNDLSNLFVMFNYDSDSAVPTQFVIDGDLHAPGAVYGIGSTRLVTGAAAALSVALQDELASGARIYVENQTIGLQTAFFGLTHPDDIFIYLPGGTVNANLTATPQGSIHIDGRARLAGTNPNAPNVINVLARAGSVSMTPLDTYDSLLTAYNPVHIYGSMPQDALNVTQPTEFRMASTLAGESQVRFDFALNGAAGFTATSPTARYTVHSTVAQVPIDPLNPDPLSVVPTPINPITAFVDRAIMYQDLTRSPLEAQKIAIRGNTIPWTFNVDGVFVTIPVEVIVNLQIYPVNLNPIATDNHANFDASQLRGTFGYQVSEPDYAYAELLADGLIRGSAPPATNFGQSYVTISKTNPQLTTTITGTTPVTTSHYNPLVAFTGGGTVSRWAGTQVVVGTGNLATLEGNLTVNQAWLKEVDNRNAALADIIQMTTAGMSWGANDGERTSLTLNNLQGKLTVTGSVLDRFAIEGTPNSAYRTVLRNFSTAATPLGVYVMGKNVMPLEVSGNFDLAVGRRLNLDGTVTNVGTILGAYDDVKNYVNTGSVVFLLGNLSGVWQDFALLPTTSSIAGPITWFNSGYLTSLVGGAQPKPPLPIYYNYSGPGQGTFIFDASNETVTDRVLGDMIVQYGGASLNGISSNSNYAGKANLRFYESEVIYGPNTNVYWYGAKIRTNTNALDVVAPTLLNNLLNGTVRYFANPANVGLNPIEQILIGAALGPIYVEGSGRNTRVEINPLFSQPTSLAMGIFDTSINNQSFAIGSHPGWGGGHTGGYSLIDTVQANVSVSGAALRVIGDIPLPVGSPPVGSRPNVTIGGSSITGIAGAAINYSNLADSVIPGSFTFNSQLDLNALNFPGLNVQLPAHYPVDTTVQNTPAGATTHVSTVLSSANNTYTNGVLNVLATTGQLILGEMYRVAPTNGDKFNWPGLAGSISTSWSDGISVSQINIGNNGSLAGIQGAILLKGDSHQTTTTVTNIDGRNDAARSNVQFVRPTYTSNPFPSQFPYQHVEGLAPVPIYFSDFYIRPHLLNVYGSADSTYNVAYGPLDMKLYQGAGSNTTIRTTPLTVVGGNLVTLLMPNGLTVPNYVGVPEIYVQQDPANPAPIDIVVERANTSSNANFRLESTDNGMMRLKDTFVLSPFTEYWRLNYKGSDAAISVNYGTITVADTGSLGTTASSKAAVINVLGTTGDLKILPVGTATGNATVTLGDNRNMQAILGNVEVTPNTAMSLSLDNFNDTVYREIHMSHAGGVFTVTGMSPGTIKWFGTFSPTLYGGSGGSTFVLDDMPTLSGFLSINGGSSNNDTLVGPNVDGLYNLLNTNSGQLNSKIAFSGIENLRGGSGDDTFRFLLFGSNNVLSGGIDGGLGTDTVVYDNASWWRSVPYDLSIGRLPLASGISTSIERAPFDVVNPGNKTSAIGETITPITVGRYGGPLSVTWSATNLPAGLSIDPTTGVISGTISSQTAGSRTVQVSATDGTYSSNASFTWNLQGIIITNPGAQTTALGAAVNLQLTATGTGTRTFSASNLPTGLSIDTQTGLISGTVVAQFAGNRTVTVSVSDGINNDSTNFNWLLNAHTLATPDDQTYDVGATITPIAVIANNANLPLFWAASSLPNGLTINPQTGVISGTIINESGAVGAHSISVVADDGYNYRGTFFTLNVVGFGLIGPSTVVSGAGDVVSLQIQSIGAPSNVVYSAENLPVGLSIHPDTGLITGTIAEEATLTGLYEVYISATDGNVFADVRFDWRVIGFSIESPGDQFVPEGVPLAIQLPVTNLQNETLEYSILGDLPAFLYVDQNAVLRGTFYVDAPSSGVEEFYVTVIVSNGFATDSATFKITTYDGFYINNVYDRGNYAGAFFESSMQPYSPYGHDLSVTVSGLPDGLTVDENLMIRGTISQSAVANSPHVVMVQITNNTLNDADGPGGPDYTYTISYNWRVERLPTAAELNAGSPDGVPQLLTVVDPMVDSGPQWFRGITYQSGHSVVYFATSNQLFQVVDGAASVVQSVDPVHTTISEMYRFSELPGRGIVFLGDGKLWIVEEAGARVLSEFEGNIDSDFSQIGNSYYAGASVYGSVGDLGSGGILQISFDAGGEATASLLEVPTNGMFYGAFAGGLLVNAYDPDWVQSIYWFDPTNGQMRHLATTAQDSYFQSLSLGVGTGGSETLYILEYVSTGYHVLAIQSASVQSGSPAVVSLPIINALQGYPTVMGDKLVYGEAVWNGSEAVITFTVTDGTLAGTTTYTSPFATNDIFSSRVSEMVAVGNDMYFVFYPDYELLSPSTLVSQIVKFDSVAGTFTAVANFYGWDAANYQTSNLTAAEDGIYFTAWNEDVYGKAIWSYDPAGGLKVIDAYVDNSYSDPSRLAFINDALYFRGRTTGVPNLDYDQPSNQAWILRPAEIVPGLPGDFNHDNTVDAADYVSLRKNGGTPEDFTAFRANFGRSLPAGGSGASLSIEDENTDSTSSSPASAPATDNTIETVAMPAPMEVLSHDLSSTTISFATSLPEDSTASAPLSPLQSDSTPAPRFFSTADTYQPVFTRVSRANTSVADSISIDLDDLLLSYQPSSWDDDFLGEVPMIENSFGLDAESDDANHASLDEAFADFDVVLMRKAGSL